MLALWHNKPGDKFFICNPYEDEFIFGSGQSDDFKNAPYHLYPLTFFAKKNEVHPKVFAHYCIIKNGAIVYNSFPALPEKLELKKIKHTLTRHDDSYGDWQTLFQAVQKKIAEKEFEKIVAARKIEFTCVEHFDITSILFNLFEKNINSYIFAYQQKDETFFGASPELLVEKKVNQVKSFALAGTMIKSERELAEQKQKFLSDNKNIFEHKIVTDSIVQSFKKLGQNVEVGESHILELKNLFHLKTEVWAQDGNGVSVPAIDTLTLKEPMQTTPQIRLLDWVAELHPTPALGGSPREAALKFLKEHEQFDRAYYGAPFGVVDAQGDGFFIVAIRAALVKGRVLSAYAGCGIVAQSDCAEEFVEIDNKLRTIIEAL